MSFSANANKWSPKLIIGFQLTIWCIVGIILLQKGAISLYDTKEVTRNDTADIQGKLMTWNENESIQESSIAEKWHRFVERKIATPENDRVAVDNLGTVVQNERWPRKLFEPYRKSNIDTGITEKSSIIDKLTTMNRKQDSRDIRAIQAQTIHTTSKNEVGKMYGKENIIIAQNLDENGRNGKKIVTSNNTSSTLFRNFGPTDLLTLNESKFFDHGYNDIRYEASGIGKNETKSERSPVNRVGAAVAIIMLAIGVVMLLLGPLIVILRAFADRRRTRQMLLKSRCRSDQPPTYEEATATLMDEAPRYSTLQLDTIPESSFSL
ncbi:uncharacterized protein LOC122394783 [Colletes gigas]|uniref:uncharacterized protein LOC122394783 n=1 Tax=Colletes gigas TaxID=935657 RepID=UPI001C9A3DC5|nr:uncharacterized protein LOC122394783 [Colletes gigas]XP_043247844.1 uncharacterized protein LOC122394783 [Colletes gigas]XP_043247845.1 uncharacterized protein LOC122394783 [Colletes gigas]XP_043247846.1 uncharacterized protein LOC122394783 [Colletes gigas]XP_043247847.1 uncharacterized protein LOC122394783 [Colletes gigas]